MTRHIHIDAVGGISGDMFISAMLSIFPQAEAQIQADLSAAGLAAHITMTPQRIRKSGFAAMQMQVTQHPAAPPTRHWREIRAFLCDGGLRERVRSRALEIFTLLAEAEAVCHDVPVEDVHFHEVADWDSLADIIAAASVICKSGVERWSVGALPLGHGRVQTQHGLIAVPAPATAHLLGGFGFVDDGVAGERITPTGAAILRHLAPASDGPTDGAKLLGAGTGAGQRELQGIPNICRLLHFDLCGASYDQVSEIAFEIDDMTPEEIAVALGHIRKAKGVIDAGYTLGYGKKGRVRYGVTVLAEPATSDAVAQLCFEETSTLGLRLAQPKRRVLHREAGGTDGLKTKSASRPTGTTTKVESDDLAKIATLRARRAAAQNAETGDD